MPAGFATDLADTLRGAVIRQINHSHTVQRGSVRGMHFQHAPHAEKKIIRCLTGKIFDVVVDLRRGSPTFLAWRGFELEAGDDRALLIPEGCAHGFQVLEPDSELLYLHTAAFCAQAEAGVGCQDPSLGITWPLPVTGLSARDASHPPIASGFKGIAL